MMDLEAIARALRCSAHAAYILSLNGLDSSFKYFNRVKTVEVGMMVFEATTVGVRKFDLIAVGRLVRIAQEDYPVTDWPEDEPIPKETVHYIEGLDGREYRWTNAMFIGIPETPHSMWP